VSAIERDEWRNNAGCGGSCSKPRPVRLTDFMTMAET